MQVGYWSLELVKLIVGFSLVRWCYREMMQQS